MKKRKSVWLEEKQIKDLNDNFKRTGTRPSESVRRAIDLYLKLQEKENGKSTRK